MTNWITTDTNEYPPEDTDYIIKVELSIGNDIKSDESTMYYHDDNGTWTFNNNSVTNSLLDTVLATFLGDNSKVGVVDIKPADSDDDFFEADTTCTSSDYNQIASIVLQQMVNTDKGLGNSPDAVHNININGYHYTNLTNINTSVKGLVQTAFDEYIGELRGDSNGTEGDYSDFWDYLKNIKYPTDPDNGSGYYPFIVDGDEWNMRMKINDAGGGQISYFTLRINWTT